MPLPVMTPEQRADALLKAAQVRAERADVKDRLKKGTLTLAEVIKDAATSDVTGKMKVSAVIQSLPGMGKSKTAQLMGNLGIAENKRVRGLSARQRAALETAFAPLDA
jgi:S13-like H2TH domain